MLNARDFALVHNEGKVNVKTVEGTFDLFGIDELGLDETDRKILTKLITQYGGGPAGIDALASAMGLERDAIEQAHEPYLLIAGLMTRGPSGRLALPLAYKHLGLSQASGKRLEGVA